MAEPLLALTGLEKSFGALAATDGVDLEVRPGEIHALIGPNGAGKTTLVNQIAGELLPDKGMIRFKHSDITRWPVHKRARAGMARTFQITNVFSGLTVSANLDLAIQAALGHSFKFWIRAENQQGLAAQREELLALLGLADLAGQPAGCLSHGEKRKLAIAMALAGGPELILLDEPAAGMDKEASAGLARLLDRIRKTYGILLVEHDMDLVFSLADRVSVLVYGKIIATGSPEAVRTNPLVAEAYLGDSHA